MFRYFGIVKRMSHSEWVWWWMVSRISGGTLDDTHKAQDNRAQYTVQNNSFEQTNTTIVSTNLKPHPTKR